MPGLTANSITLSRIPLALAMLVCLRTSWVFLVLHCICGLSDLLDGALARKLGTQSHQGARLDSVADVIWFGVVGVFLFDQLGLALAGRWLWVLVIAGIRFGSLVISWYRYGRPLIRHTRGNRLAGLLLFLVPVELVVLGSIYLAWPLGVISLISAVEEGALHFIEDRADLDRPSIFRKR